MPNGMTDHFTVDRSELAVLVSGFPPDAVIAFLAHSAAAEVDAVTAAGLGGMLAEYEGMYVSLHEETDDSVRIILPPLEIVVTPQSALHPRVPRRHHPTIAVFVVPKGQLQRILQRISVDQVIGQAAKHRDGVERLAVDAHTLGAQVASCPDEAILDMVLEHSCYLLRLRPGQPHLVGVDKESPLFEIFATASPRASRSVAWCRDRVEFARGSGAATNIRSTAALGFH